MLTPLCGCFRGRRVDPGEVFFSMVGSNIVVSGGDMRSRSMSVLGFSLGESLTMATLVGVVPLLRVSRSHHIPWVRT